MKNFGMKLNLDKFVFMVESEKILSYIVSQRGIDVNLVQTNSKLPKIGLVIKENSEGSIATKMSLKREAQNSA